MRPADVPATLLNMSLLNLGSANAKLRLASYNLLANVATTFNFHIGGEIMEAGGLVIPENNNNFIIRISKCLSKAEPGLTLEFLDECITGIRNSTSEQKQVCLEYMEPWLQYLCGDLSREKVRAIIKGLVELTMHEKDLYPSLQANVWSTVARVDDLALQVIEQMISSAIEQGPDTIATELLADAAVSLGSVNTALVANAVVVKVLSTLKATSSSSTTCLSEHSLWPHLQVLSRFLLKLSFNNCLDVEKNLASIWFIVTMLVGVGTASMRATVHAIVTNVTQSMCTSLQLSQESLTALRIKLEDMRLPKVLLQFGVPTKQKLSDLVYSGLPSSSRGHAPFVTTTPLELVPLQGVIDVLHDIMCACEEHEERWRNHWLQLLLEVAEDTSNSALRPRAFVALGIITRDISSNLMSVVLGTLSSALGTHNISLVDAILASLARLLALVQAGDFDFHMVMFWASLAILQAGIKKLCSSALSVLETTVNAMDSHGVFETRSVADVVLSAREKASELFDILEKECGTSFSKNFSFAMSATLLRALDHPNSVTILRARRLLMTFLTTAHNLATASGVYDVVRNEGPSPPMSTKPLISSSRSTPSPFTDEPTLGQKSDEIQHQQNDDQFCRRRKVYRSVRARAAFDIARAKYSIRRLERDPYTLNDRHNSTNLLHLVSRRSRQSFENRRKDQRVPHSIKRETSGYIDVRVSPVQEEDSSNQIPVSENKLSNTDCIANNNSIEAVQTTDMEKDGSCTDSSRSTVSAATTKTKTFSPTRASTKREQQGFFVFDESEHVGSFECNDQEEIPLYVSEAMLGYVCALLPIDEDIQESFVTKGGTFKFAHIISVAQDASASLMVVMLCSQLNQCAHRLREQAFLLEFLAEFAFQRPEPFHLVEEELLETLHRILRRVHEPELAHHCHRLIHNLVEATTKPSTSSPVRLDDIGFSGLWSASTFPSLSEAENKHRLALCGKILSQMLSETQRSRAASASLAAYSATSAFSYRFVDDHNTIELDRTSSCDSRA